MSTLRPQADQIRQTTATALTLATDIRSVDSLPRVYVAEMIAVRLYSLFEAIIEDSACRLICGAKYCDGSSPRLQRPHPTRGFERARDAMRTFERPKPEKEKFQLRWGRAREIRKNLEYLFPPREHFIDTVVGHGQFISDLRKMRNHIAHGSVGTRRKFDEVVRNYYGANVNAITPGKMLLSSRFSPQRRILLETFCQRTRIILLAAIKGQS